MLESGYLILIDYPASKHAMSYQPDFPPPPSQHKRGRRKPQKPPKQQRRRTPAPRPATPPGTQPPAYPPAGYPPGYGPEYGSGYGLPPGQPGARQHPVRRRGRRGCSIGPGCIFGCIGFVGVIMLGLLIAG
ncbi:MAG: hypothetical protein JXQ72_09440, partial [Anaerolineae bacterium]|nr:hypothetical protein [Anaerolineae bacterium]